MMWKEEGVLPEETLKCCKCGSLKVVLWKRQTSDVFSLTNKNKKSVPIGEKFFEIHWVEWFYMTKQLHYKMPLASLERHQMYKDDLFLDFNCVIILAAPKRLVLHEADFPLAKPAPLHLGLSHTLLTLSSRLWLTRTKKNKNTENGEEYLFHQGMINWYKWLKQWEIMKWIWKEASQEKLCLFQAYFNELFITGQEKLLCVFFFWSSFAK